MIAINQYRILNGNGLLKKVCNILLLFLLLTQTSCAVLFGPGLSDWAYNLEKGYSIEHINSDAIYLCRESTESSSEIILKKTILKFQYENGFIGMQCREDYDGTIENEQSFYYYDFTIEELFGPMTEEQYYLMLDQEGKEKTKEWVLTSPAPKGAIFPTLF